MSRVFTLKLWQLLLVVMVAVGVGAGAYGSTTPPSEDTVPKHVYDAAVEARNQARAERAGAVEEARAEAESDLAAREAELEQRAREIADHERTVNRQLDEREAEVVALEEATAMREFGTGAFEVGVDIEPGKYRTDGAPNCYWAKLRISDRDIIDNNISDGPQVVVLEAGILFESQGCGTWTLQQ